MNYILTNIKHKLRAAFLLLIILSVVGGFLSFHLLSKVSDSQKIKNDIANLVIVLNEARRVEKDFLLFDRKTISFLEHGKSPGTIKHKHLISSLDSAIAALKEEDFINSLALQTELNSIETSVRTYHLSFKNLVESMYVRGFKDHGLEGQMRSYVHDLQKCISPQEKVFAFSLRRHEKDFLMRKDMQYMEKLHKTAEAFKTFVLQSDMAHMDSTYKTATISAINAYIGHFNKIVKIEKEIGLTEESGIIGKMNVEANSIEPLVAHIYHAINNKAASSYKNSMIVLIGSIVLLFLIGLVLSLSLSAAISKPIVLLDKATKAVLNGTSNITLQLKSIELKDEIGSLISNFIAMVEKIEENLKVITEKNNQLEAAALEDSKRNWKNSGINQFSDILKNNKNMEELGPEIITMLVNYTRSNQGMLFVINEENKEDPFMEMIGCYAYEKRKYLSSRKFRKGEGLLGTTWIEKEKIFLTDVPGNYINITSGLGEATPRSILIVPVIADEEVVGLIEIASFSIFESHEISFVEAVAERLANNISSIKTQQNTQLLLKEFSQEIEALKAHEEELKQNLEASYAVQEEMTRDNTLVRKKTASLEKYLALNEKIIGKVYDGLIITNEDLKIDHINTFTEDKLKIGLEVIDKHINKVFDLGDDLVQSLNNDPEFLNNHIIQSEAIGIKSRSGKIMNVYLVVTRIEVEKQIKYVFLYHHLNYDTMKRYHRNKLMHKLSVFEI